MCSEFPGTPENWGWSDMIWQSKIRAGCLGVERAKVRSQGDAHERIQSFRLSLIFLSIFVFWDPHLEFSAMNTAWGSDKQVSRCTLELSRAVISAPVFIFEFPVFKRKKDYFQKKISKTVFVYDFGSVLVYGTSTLIGYLLPNIVFTSILNTWFINTFLDTQLKDQTVLFLTVQFSKCYQS